MKLVYLSLIFFFFFVFTAQSQTIHSNEDVEITFEKGKTQVYFEENGQAVGIATEIVEELFRIAGYQPQIKMYPWKPTLLLIAAHRSSNRHASQT